MFIPTDRLNHGGYSVLLGFFHLKVVFLILLTSKQLSRLAK